MEENLTEEERQQSIRNFRIRERGRFRDGEYQHCTELLDDVDFRMAYDSLCQRTGVPYRELHYLHWSVKDPEMVAYTPSLEYGIRDRQVRVKLGRYLAKHFGHLLSEKKRLELVEKHNATALANCKFHIAMTPGRIETVYTRGPTSCMGYSRYRFAHNFHPTRIYGAGDLGVAFMWRQDTDGRQRITARALVWPHKMIHGRVYGDESRLKAMLADRGYTENWMGFEGAAVLHELPPYDDTPHAPYIDADLGLSPAPDGEILLLTNESEAEWGCKGQRGLAHSPGEPCSCCGDYTREENQQTTYEGEMICEHCYGEYYFFCEHTSAIHHMDDALTTAAGDLISQVAYEQAYFTCDDTDEIYPDAEGYTTFDGRTVCSEVYFDDYFTCESCGEIYPNEQANHCDETGKVRCDDCHAEHEEEKNEAA